MAIYVDVLQEYPNKRGKWCHMMTDSDDLTELHRMAVRLGIRRYFQNHKTHPHYDLIPSKRSLAVRYGAIEVSGVEMVRRCSAVFKGKESGL